MDTDGRILRALNNLRLTRLELMTLQVEHEQRRQQAVPFFLKGAIRNLEEAIKDTNNAAEQVAANVTLDETLRRKVRSLNGNN